MIEGDVIQQMAVIVLLRIATAALPTDGIQVNALDVLDKFFPEDTKVYKSKSVTILIINRRTYLYLNEATHPMAKHRFFST